MMSSTANVILTATETTTIMATARKPQIIKETQSENETVDKTKTKKANGSSNKDDLADSLSEIVVNDDKSVRNNTHRNKNNETVFVQTTTTKEHVTVPTTEAKTTVHPIGPINAIGSSVIERKLESEDLTRANNNNTLVDKPVVTSTTTLGTTRVNEEDGLELFTTLEPDFRTFTVETETESGTETIPEIETITIMSSPSTSSQTPVTSPSSSPAPTSTTTQTVPPSTTIHTTMSSSPSPSPSPTPSTLTTTTSPKVSSTTTYIPYFDLPVNESSTRKDYYEVYNSSSSSTPRPFHTSSTAAVTDFNLTSTTISTTTQSTFQPNQANNNTALILQIAAGSTIFCLALIVGVIMFIRKRRFSSLQFAQNSDPMNSTFGRSSFRKMTSRFSIRSLVRQSFSNKSPPSRKLTAEELVQSILHPVQLNTEFARLPKTNVNYSEVPEGCEDKNRYANVIPLPETRVRLITENPHDECAQYINANYVQSLAEPDRHYIACQAPMENTIEDFWQMVWENNTKAIIMLTDFVEDNKEKCAVYLPLSEVIDSTKTFRALQVTLKKRDFFDKYNISYLELKHLETGNTQDVVHFAYIDWPERKLPSESRTIVTILQRVNALVKRRTLLPQSPPQPDNKSLMPPLTVVVHCSTGTGRTGTVIAIDTAIHQFHQTQTVDIPTIVTNIRQGRARAVETRDQYSFIYKNRVSSVCGKNIGTITMMMMGVGSGADSSSGPATNIPVSVEQSTIHRGDKKSLSLLSGIFRSSIIGSGNAVADETGGGGATRRKSFVQYALEVFPRFENYANSKKSPLRPSIGELHNGENDLKESTIVPVENEQAPVHHKLGWIQGVLIPVLLNIWGVMLFLRLSWVVGQAGIGESLIIVFLSAVVCVITTLSLSAISTNGEVKGGGIYFIISRSLGPEFGASIGLVFAFANAISASMNTIGFCDSLNQLLESHDLKIIDNGIQDTRIIGIVALLIMIFICAVGMDWETKAQNFLVAIISVAIGCFIIGAIRGPNSVEDIAQGFVGLSTETFRENWNHSYQLENGVQHNFFTVFSIFFPSVTGIQAGANISGDLKDPSYAIPKGTMIALIISMISYIVFILISGAAEKRSVSGLLSDVSRDGTNVRSCLASAAATDVTQTCQYGLLNSYEVMQLISQAKPLIYAGCFSATISTALTNLLSVPKLIQALGTDQIYPGLHYFAKGFGKNREPYRGYLITFLISAVFILIGNLNAIAPLISNFYLASYALINFCTFHACLIKPLGWRPTFKAYNMWVSLMGFLLCVLIMFLIDWVMSLVTFIIILALYLVVVYRKPNVNWGSSMQAEKFKNALTMLYRMSNTREHVKNYQPNILVLGGFGRKQRPELIDMANLITKNKSLMIVADVIEKKLSFHDRNTRINVEKFWLDYRNVRCFYNFIEGIKSDDAIRSLIQISGIGKLRPNIIMIGYKNDWRKCPTNDLNTYFNTLHNTFDNRLALIILRNVTDGEDEEPETICESDNSATCYFVERMARKSQFLNADKLITSKTSDMFRVRQKDGTIDVWWLYDDGGLTILIPYILSNRKNWAHLSLRVFAISSKMADLQSDQQKSLPIPQRRLVTAPIYMAWLEIITNKMPPFLLIRGNQSPVLTFYSE